ncbi:hypothetical protein GCM10010365_44860 [Streptomyces poonensis]|uniref:Uncharacterized protein n=1 Tax=Streptomyces poonensis TaxID=68255 RepID=A0A918PT43_9ACTN|nr:hypothetical protein GCM10010365_44860 [Streptomyces poonensis]
MPPFSPFFRWTVCVTDSPAATWNRRLLFGADALFYESANETDTDPSDSIMPLTCTDESRS